MKGLSILCAPFGKLYYKGGGNSAKLHYGTPASLSGLYIPEFCEAMALRPAATIPYASGQRIMLTSFTQFKINHGSHIKAIPTYPPNQPLTGARVYSLLNLTTSIPDTVMRSCFKKTIGDMGPKRLNQCCNMVGDLFMYLVTELVPGDRDPVTTLKMLTTHVSNRTVSAAEAINKYAAVLSSPVTLQLVSTYNELAAIEDKDGQKKVLSLLAGGGARPFLPYPQLAQLPFKPKVSMFPI